MRNFFIAALFLFSGVSLLSQSRLNMVHVNNNVYMLQGRGGNIGLNVGTDGILMVDDQFADATPAILEEIRKLSEKPIEFLVNTHHHGDHTGGNENMTKNGTIIFSHKNVRKRLVDARKNPDSPKISDESFPVVTFNRKITFHYNGEDIEVFHVANAHTDGDALVYFKKSNVLHTGDVFFKGRYPYIDTNSGGDLFGYIEALEQVLANINENTLIIPGHGDVATFNDLRATIAMLSIVMKRVSFHYLNKKTLEQVLAMPEITEQYDAKGFGDYYISTEKFIRMVYAEVKEKRGEWR